MNEVSKKAKAAESMNWKVLRHEIDSEQETVMALATDEESAQKIACKLSEEDKDVFYTVEAL